MSLTILLRTLFLVIIFLLPILIKAQHIMLDMRAVSPKSTPKVLQQSTGVATIDNFLRNLSNFKKMFDKKKLKDYRFQATTFNFTLPIKFKSSSNLTYGLVFYYAKPKRMPDELIVCRHPLAACSFKLKWKFFSN